MVVKKSRKKSKFIILCVYIFQVKMAFESLLRELDTGAIEETTETHGAGIYR